jgi:hypothetical protein
MMQTPVTIVRLPSKIETASKALNPRLPLFKARSGIRLPLLEQFLSLFKLRGVDDDTPIRLANCKFHRGA